MGRLALAASLALYKCSKKIKTYTVVPQGVMSWTISWLRTVTCCHHEVARQPVKTTALGQKKKSNTLHHIKRYTYRGIIMLARRISSSNSGEQIVIEPVQSE